MAPELKLVGFLCEILPGVTLYYIRRTIADKICYNIRQVIWR